MEKLQLHEFHQELGAIFESVSGSEAVSHYGDVIGEHDALRSEAGVLDLSFRSRLCLTGANRVRFLHGQVTNDVKSLRAGQGCYAALVTAKGRMEADLNIYCLPEELLLDFEPGLEAKLSKRLEAFIVADDVQVVNVAPVYGLLSVQGPKAADVVSGLELFPNLPENEFEFQTRLDDALGEIYLVNLPRLRTRGFDLYVPVTTMPTVAAKLVAAGKTAGGRICGWEAFELARVEAGVPRFSVDMDETHFPQECGIEARAVSYSKGCYIGQEVLNRIHTMGHVNRQLCGLRLGEELRDLPVGGDKLLLQDKEVGWVTSAITSPVLRAKVALGYVRRELTHAGTELVLHTATGASRAQVTDLPFC